MSAGVSDAGDEGVARPSGRRMSVVHPVSGWCGSVTEELRGAVGEEGGGECDACFGCVVFAGDGVGVGQADGGSGVGRCGHGGGGRVDVCGG